MTTRLKSYVEGRWVEGVGEGTPLFNPTTEEVVAECSTQGIDFAAALEYGRKGGAALRKMTFQERGELLLALSNAIYEYRNELLDLSTETGGNTRGDAKFDVDGATGTMAYYASLGKKLGGRRFLTDGDMQQLTRAPRYVGQHIMMPRLGVAAHINAYNFPAWGMGEKLAVSMLAGVPAVVKPAPSTAPVAARFMKIMVDSGLLPDGALSFIAGSCEDMVEHLDFQDMLAFTGSAKTGNLLRSKPNIIHGSVPVNVEADSLNSAVLGPGVDFDSDTYEMFLRETAKEITQKAGQKCTATRRIFVHQDMIQQVIADLSDRLGEVRVGDPALREVRMGPVATRAQLEDTLAGMEELKACAELVYGGGRGALVGVEDGKGYFISPTLFYARDPGNAHAVHTREVFGPSATLMPYGSSTDELCDWVGLGRGGLVSSVYADDRDFVEAMVLGIAPYHGRITVGSARVADHSPGPGAVLPTQIHGGPGRAGGGEELGGLRGLSFYMQRTAVQGSKPLLEKIFSE